MLGSLSLLFDSPLGPLPVLFNINKANNSNAKANMSYFYSSVDCAL